MAWSSAGERIITMKMRLGYRSVEPPRKMKIIVVEKSETAVFLGAERYWLTGSFTVTFPGKGEVQKIVWREEEVCFFSPRLSSKIDKQAWKLQYPSFLKAHFALLFSFPPQAHRGTEIRGFSCIDGWPLIKKSPVSGGFIILTEMGSTLRARWTN